MSTQVFLRAANLAACDAWGSGIAAWNPNTAFYSSGINGNTIFALRLDRGSGAAQFDGSTVVSSTARHRFVPLSGGVVHFVSPPLDRDVTIASTITFNLWMLENSMNANVQAACYIARISPAGVLSAAINASTDGVELGTSIAAMNWTSDATDLACNRGDRLLIVPYFTNIGTQAGGFTVSLRYNGPTDGADGDSYVMFTEDFGFMESVPSNFVSERSSGTNTLQMGDTASRTRTASVFRGPAAGEIGSVDIALQKVAAPTDNVEVAIQADSSGAPSGTDLSTGSVAGTSLTTSLVVYTLAMSAVTLAADTTYWLVVRRSTAVNATNYYRTGIAWPLAGNGGSVLQWNGSTWSVAQSDAVLAADINTTSTTTLYPTTTAGQVDPNGASYDSKEAWTSRGSGSVASIVDAVVAPASPLLMRVSAGSSNFVEYFSRGLQAFTLAGPVLVNIWEVESGAATNATVGVELAVCASDGTSPTIWGYTLEGVEAPTTGGGSARQVLVAGDDVAVTAGQRIRVRFYTDDASAAAMAASGQVGVYYAGTSGGAAGDTYLTFGQALAELVAALAPPPRHPPMHLLAR